MASKNMIYFSGSNQIGGNGKCGAGATGLVADFDNLVRDQMLLNEKNYSGGHDLYWRMCLIIEKCYCPQ